MGKTGFPKMLLNAELYNLDNSLYTLELNEYRYDITSKNMDDIFIKIVYIYNGIPYKYILNKYHYRREFINKLYILPKNSIPSNLFLKLSGIEWKALPLFRVTSSFSTTV